MRTSRIFNSYNAVLSVHTPLVPSPACSVFGNALVKAIASAHLYNMPLLHFQIHDVYAHTCEDQPKVLIKAPVWMG